MSLRQRLDAIIRAWSIPFHEDLQYIEARIRRGPLVTSPFLPQSVRRLLLRCGGVSFVGRPAGLRSAFIASRRVTVGEGAWVGAGFCVEGGGSVSIGADTAIGPEVMVVTSHHDRNGDGTLGPQICRAVVVGARCWVGARALILPGVTIGDDVTIGGGAVVTKDCPGPGLYAGVPARKIG